MGVTSYYSFGGEIIGEETSGVRRDYLTDALGSVTATVTDAGAVENTYRYKSYGETLVKTGTGSDPKFLWNGKWGYWQSSEQIYVRTRFYRRQQASWLSKDLLKLNNPYYYVAGQPTSKIDYFGDYMNYLNGVDRIDFACKQGRPVIQVGHGKGNSNLGWHVIPRELPYFGCMQKVCEISKQFGDFFKDLDKEYCNHGAIKCGVINDMLLPVDPGKHCYKPYDPSQSDGMQGDFCHGAKEVSIHCGETSWLIGSGGRSWCCQECGLRMCQLEYDCGKQQMWPKIDLALQYCKSRNKLPHINFGFDCNYLKKGPIDFEARKHLGFMQWWKQHWY